MTGQPAARSPVVQVQGYVREGEQVQDLPIGVAAAIAMVNNPCVGRDVQDPS